MSITSSVKGEHMQEMFFFSRRMQESRSYPTQFTKTEYVWSSEKALLSCIGCQNHLCRGEVKFWIIVTRPTVAVPFMLTLLQRTCLLLLSVTWMWRKMTILALHTNVTVFNCAEELGKNWCLLIVRQIRSQSKIPVNYENDNRVAVFWCKYQWKNGTKLYVEENGT